MCCSHRKMELQTGPGFPFPFPGLSGVAGAAHLFPPGELQGQAGLDLRFHKTGEEEEEMMSDTSERHKEEVSQSKQPDSHVLCVNLQTANSPHRHLPNLLSVPRRTSTPCATSGSPPGPSWPPAPGESRQPRNGATQSGPARAGELTGNQTKS